ncbi:MAG: hypothetical protein ACQESR_23530 [Planctomycetota bacterium]
MKQILQPLKTGTMELAELPAPAVTRGMVLIQTMRSLISAGTERMLVEFSKGNLIQKACSRKRGGQFAVSDSLHACRLPSVAFADGPP